MGLLDPDEMFLRDEVEDQIDDIPDTAGKAIQIAKLEMMRVSREKNLREVFPDLRPGYSYHIISKGDVDALSYLTLMIERHGPFDDFYGSTWTMSRQDCELLDKYLADGLIKRINFFTGEYFAKRETSVYATLLKVVEKHQGRLRMFKNHCKLLLVQNTEKQFWAVAEGSANFTTNPRTEQTTITVSRELYDFYKGWFEELLINAK
jgi:hypothetical protein